jgi:hypothetical protein
MLKDEPIPAMKVFPDAVGNFMDVYFLSLAIKMAVTVAWNALCL